MRRLQEWDNVSRLWLITRNRTESFNYISAFYVLANVVASVTGSLLLTNHIYMLNSLGLLCSVAAVLISLVISQYLGLVEKVTHSETDASDSEQDSNAGFEAADREIYDRRKIIHLLLTSWRHSLTAIFTSYRLASPTFEVVLIFFLSNMCARVEVLNPQYISLRLSWPLESVNSLLALRSLASACSSALLPTLRKRYLEPSRSGQQCDVFIIRTCLFLSVLGILGVGSPLPIPLFVLALCLCANGNSFLDSLTTFGAVTLIPGETIPDYFLRTGLIQTFGGLLAAPIWASIFSFCVASPGVSIGTPYWLSALSFGGISVIALRLMKYVDHTPVTQTG